MIILLCNYMTIFAIKSNLTPHVPYNLNLIKRDWTVSIKNIWQYLMTLCTWNVWQRKFDWVVAPLIGPCNVPISKSWYPPFLHQISNIRISKNQYPLREIKIPILCPASWCLSWVSQCPTLGDPMSCSPTFRGQCPLFLGNVPCPAFGATGPF